MPGELGAFGDWTDDGYDLPVFNLHPYFNKGEQHPAYTILEILRAARAGRRDDSFERRFILQLKAYLGTRDKFVAEGLYWKWGILNPTDWARICEQTRVVFADLTEVGAALFLPSRGESHDSVAKWARRVIEERPGYECPIKEVSSLSVEREVSVPVAYLLKKDAAEDRYIERATLDEIARQADKLREMHAELAKPLPDEDDLAPPTYPTSWREEDRKLGKGLDTKKLWLLTECIVAADALEQRLGVTAETKAIRDVIRRRFREGRR